MKGAASMPTIGIDFKMKSIMIDSKRVKIQVVSTHIPSGSKLQITIMCTSFKVGYCRSGALPKHNKDILPQCSRCRASVRYHR